MITRYQKPISGLMMSCSGEQARIDAQHPTWAAKVPRLVYTF
jgi:hypothetical protein